MATTYEVFSAHPDFVRPLYITLSYQRPAEQSSIATTLASTISSGAITDIQSDGFGSYLDGVEAVASFLTTNGYNRIVWGDWQFGALSSTTRKVRLSIANPIQLLQQFITGASFQKKCCSPARLLL